MPIFASSLGLLEPVKLKTDTNHSTNHVNHSENNTVKDTDCLSSDKSSPSNSLNCLNATKLICDDDLDNCDTIKQTGKFRSTLF